MPKLGPSLAFYVQHADDANALYELYEDNDGCAPEGISVEDWKLFVEVFDHASSQIAELVTACRDTAISVLESSGLKCDRRGYAPTAEQWWDQYAGFKARGKGQRQRVLYVGAALWAMPGDKVYLIPWAQLYHGDNESQLELQQMLQRHGLQKHKADLLRWWANECEDDEAVPLAFIPVMADSEIAELEAEARTAFGVLAKNSARVVKLAERRE